MPDPAPSTRTSSAENSPYTLANKDSLSCHDPAAIEVAGNASVISAATLVELLTAMILARPPALPMISPRTFAAENSAALAVKVAASAGATGSVRVIAATGLVGAG